MSRPRTKTVPSHWSVSRCDNAAQLLEILGKLTIVLMEPDDRRRFARRMVGRISWLKNTRRMNDMFKFADVVAAKLKADLKRKAGGK